MSTSENPPAVEAAPDSQHPIAAVLTGRSWRSMVQRAGIAYLITRVCVIAGAGIVAAQLVADQRADPNFVRPNSAVSLLVRVFTSWDGAWYYRIVRQGYPRLVPPHVTFDML